ncbi:MAG TPA: SRPBCC family protein, partial [Candidatus Limnocylindria bacterium]
RAAVWTVLTDPRWRQRWMGVERVDYKPGARHTLVGSEYHCIHGSGQTSVFRVAEALEPERVTIAFPIMGVLVWWTTQLGAADGGRTRIVSRLRIDAPGDIGGKVRALAVRQIMKGYSTKYAKRIAEEAEALAKGVVMQPAG